MTSFTELLPAGISRRRLVEETAYLSLRPFTFVVVGALVFVVTLLRSVRWDLGEPGKVLLFLSVSLLIFVIGFSAALLLSRRLPRSLMPVVAIVLWSVLAAVRRTVEIVLANTLDAAGADASPFPIILAISSTLAWVILIAGLQAVNVLRRETSAGVEANIQQLQRLNAARWEQLDAERTTMARWIRRTVTPSMDRLSAMIAASPIRWQEPGFAKQVEKIAESSREVVRQASHDMTSLAGRAEALRGAINEAEGEVARSRPSIIVQEVRVAPVASAMIGITVLALSAPALGPAAIMALVVGPPTAFVVLWILRPVAEDSYHRLRLPRIAGVLVANFVAVAVALALANQAALWTLSNWLPQEQQAPFVLPFLEPGYAVVVILASLIITTGAALVVADGKVWALAEERLSATQSALDTLDQDMTRQYEQMCAQTTAMLHGPIQGRLATIAMTLRFEDGEVPREVVDSCRAMLDACQQDFARVASDPFSEDRSTDQILTDLRAQWSGLLAISWEVDAAAQTRLESSAGIRRRLETLVADLASNASRHGSAHALGVFVTEAGKDLCIVARDDGRGPQVPVTPGKGLGNGDGTEPQISIDDDGWCRVTVRLPLS
jgi:hypothetical protein